MRSRLPLFSEAVPRSTRATAGIASVFLGRDAELAVLDGDPAAPTRVVYVHGIAGVGKSSLVGRFTERCRGRRKRALLVDMRDLDPTPEALTGALVRGLRNGRPRTSAGEPREGVLRRLRWPDVVVIDTYQATELLDRWLVDVLLPELPAATRVVIVGRDAPSATWRAAPGWRRWCVALPLSELEPDVARALLEARGAPPHRHDEAIALARGHPLALALLADLIARDPGLTLDFAHTPDVVRALMQRFLGGIDDGRQRAALEVCALVRTIDQATLGAFVPGDDGGALFRWLATRAFIDHVATGLRPHELVRDTLVADLAWRSPERQNALNCKAIDHCIQRLRQGAVDPDRVALDVLFIHRRGLALSTDWDGASDLRADVARPDDRPAIIEMVRLHEGDDNAALAARWLDSGLEVRVVRTRDGVVAGFVAFIALERARAADIQADPATRAAWRVAKRSLRPGERANLVRWWMAADGYQTMSPAHVVLGSLMMRKNFTPGLALSLWPVSDEPHWTAVNDAAMRLTRLPLADFDSGGRRHAVLGMDFRERPMALWLAEFSRRLAGGPEPETLSDRVLLERPAFDRAVREALKQLAFPDRLAVNPLAKSRLVSDAVERGAELVARSTVLKRLIEATAGALADSPRTAHFHAALHHTYLSPAVKQEVAADLLGVSYATFRRHLAVAVALVSARLWELEIGGGEVPLL